MQRDQFTVGTFPSLDSFQSADGGKLRVLIATEEIVGPVRNGGIASTYYHLARGLAAEGHDVTVCYLKGCEVENETAEHWIEHYAQFGITFVPLPGLGEPLAGASAKWQARWLSFYRWLRDSERFDIVHSSEWRGGAFYALQAKRLGLAFQDTLFVTKTSSPYIWNRHYQMQPIDNVDLLIASFAEQKCVEWADIVVGGSAHLLSFMDHIGYALPEGRTYVQPNIVDFSEVVVEDQRVERRFGDLVKARELVFFGRLEPRKGLDLFVLAIDMLVAQGIAIDRITFLGKPGEPLATQQGMQPLDFIRERAEHWPFPIDIVTDRNQPEALSLMCSRDMIAVMPSLIENSTMAVYEALVHKIPFIATEVGGTAELIDPADHGAALVPPDTEALALRIGNALETGQPLAHPAFDNDANLATWYGFHRYVAAQGMAALAPDITVAEAHETVALIVYAATSKEVDDAVRQALETEDIDRIELYAAAPVSASARGAIDQFPAGKLALHDVIGTSAGACFNTALATVEADIFTFQAAHDAGYTPELAAMLRAASAAQPGSLFTSLFAFSADAEGGDPDTVFAPLGGDPASQTLTGAAYGLELVAGRASTFRDLGPFEAYRVPRGMVHEYITRAAQHRRDLFVIPETLVTHGGDYAGIVDQSGHGAYLAQKAMIDTAALPTRKLLLHKPAAARAQGNSGRIILGRAHKNDGETAWLTNVEKMGKLSSAPPNRHHVLLGFDCDAARLDFAVLHQGALVIRANGEAVREERNFGSRDRFTQDSIDLLPFLDDSDRLRLRIEFTRSNIQRFASILAQRIEDGIYFLSARSPIYWDGDFAEALSLIGGDRPSAKLPPLRRLAGKKPSLASRLREALR
ncbi:glycosyltransferase family 4 protein [Parasphingopyxis lamellibrachiae]|uniref:Glycosyltransferase involved in cell wall biosynthesis n=1 Tax=Parasphingopyxis lamellibrachiae TaxID=680125 RepID=A0A3D9FDW3_9SPHN|nr:glycosyltransferase family 4 protein [Parasphingopyxis lamellibrachiae]RED15767.1 glycosyltransferase involved in cell wall biosynthesis [Parasphingopyxis lamellibrachiae]